MSNKEATAALRSQLDALPLNRLSGSTLGHANYAWLSEHDPSLNWATPDGASQQFSLLRKGTTMGERNQERVAAFLTMLSEQADPARTVEELSLRNGHAPVGPGQTTRQDHLDPEQITTVTIPDSLKDILGPIEERWKTAQAEVAKREAEIESELARLKAYVDEAKTEARILLNMLKAAGVVERDKRTFTAKPGPKPTRTRQSKGSHVSDERAMEIMEKIRGFVASTEPVLPDVPGSFTRPQIERALDLNHSQVGAAVEKLREQGYVRAAGLTKTERGQKMQVFAVVA